MPRRLLTYYHVQFFWSCATKTISSFPIVQSLQQQQISGCNQKLGIEDTHIAVQMMVQFPFFILLLV